ncbi:MAG: precorrin-8X methylmutase [Thermoleophilia bacterium]
MTFSAAENRDTAIVLLGHGSRAPEAGVLLARIAASLGKRYDCPVVAASLQFNSPSLAEACRRLAADGIRRIVVAPYFLFTGNHLKEDIPGELWQLQAQLPGVELLLTGSLGQDERLVDVMQDRVDEFLAGDPGGASLQSDMETATAGPGAGPGETSSLVQHPIEAQSFDIIDGLLLPDDPAAPAYQVTRRVVHATGDPGLADALVFSGTALAAAAAAVKDRALIVCDVGMVAAGIAPTAARMGMELECAVATEDTAALSAREGITRGAAGMRLLAADRGLDGAIVAIGNAPTALFECLRLAAQEGARPALVIGVPVGFVGAAESKQALMESGLPHITLPGNRGGSNVAVAIVNALIRLSVQLQG